VQALPSNVEQVNLKRGEFLVSSILYPTTTIIAKMIIGFSNSTGALIAVIG
jgi:hypothetical protein